MWKRGISNAYICEQKRKVESYPSITGFEDREGKRSAKEAAGQGKKGGDRASKLLRQVVCATEHA